VLTFCGFLALAKDNPFAGSWRLNTAQSKGHAPSCVHDGILRIAPEIFTGSSKPKPAEGPAGVAAGKCTGVYLFTPSSDGRTLTLTQPQGHPGDKAVFEKQ
jgi:hypothetical protein